METFFLECAETFAKLFQVAQKRCWSEDFLTFQFQFQSFIQIRPIHVYQSREVSRA